MLAFELRATWPPSTLRSSLWTTTLGGAPKAGRFFLEALMRSFSEGALFVLDCLRLEKRLAAPTLPSSVRLAFDAAAAS